MLMQIATAIIARWQVALGVLGLLIVTHTLSYCTGYGNGKDAVKIDLREARVEAVEESMDRVRKGDIAGAKRAEEQAIKQAEAIKAIQEAESSDTNSLDAIF